MNNPIKTAPAEGLLCSLSCCDHMGSYVITGRRKNYAQRPNMFAFCDNGTYWRFVDSHDEEIECRDVGGWEYVEQPL